MDDCEGLVRKQDYDRYLSALFAPEAVRPDLFALYALNYEIARIAEIVRNPFAGQLRLQWYRDALEETFSGAQPRTSVLAAVARAIRTHELPKDLFDELVDGREADLDNTPFVDLAALEAYAAATSGALMRLAARVLGACGAIDREAQQAGIAYALVGLLRAAPYQAARGRLVIPQQDLQKAGVVPEDFLRGRNGEALSPLIATIARAAQRHYLSANRVDRSFLPALLPASLVPQFLRLLTAPGFHLFCDSTEISQIRRQWTMLAAVIRGRI